MAMIVPLEQQAAFCAALAECCNVGIAAKAIGVGRTTVFRWRQQDPEFAARWEAALEVGVSALEDEAHRRAFEGVDEPVWHKGEKVGAVKRYSDPMAMFLLRAHRPARYRDNSRMELAGDGGGPVMLGETERAARISAILAAAEARRGGEVLDPTLRIKMFGGRTFLDLLDAGELLPDHISAVICEAQAADAAYRRMGQSKANPTSDWQCEISIPGGGE